jgi:hypothetical protein
LPRSSVSAGTGAGNGVRLVRSKRTMVGGGVGASATEGFRRLNIGSKTARTSLSGGNRSVSVSGVARVVSASGSTITVDAS